jgi:NAD(P)H-hydrate epimerase
MHKELFTQLLNRRNDSYKFDFGHVLVIGGSAGMVGAPLLTGKAALRTGSGLVTIASTPEVSDDLEKRVEEIMTLALPKDAKEAINMLNQFIKDRKITVIVVGPGLKPSPYYQSIIENLLIQQSLPIIIDGGGLSLIKTNLDLLKKSSSSAVVLTPHLGEFERLLDKKLPDERAELKPIAASFANKYKVILVLKGHPTYVADSNDPIYENSTGGPGLATAGSGDVLSGIIAGIISQVNEPTEATEAAVYLHGLAGDITSNNKTEPGMIASDIIESIPMALKQIEVEIKD